MNNIQKFHLLSEVIIKLDSDKHPNIDMLVERPYLFYYAKKEDIPNIEKNGIVDKDNSGITVYFSRIPETEKFAQFLSKYEPIKVSVSKLVKSSEPARVIGINFPKHENEEVTLTKDNLEDLAKKSDIFSRCFSQFSDLSKIPYAKIFFKDGVIPRFAFKIVDKESDK